MRVETIGKATMYLGDCKDILPELPKVNAVITDPPYGINAARDRHSEKDGWVDYPGSGWDKERPERAVFDLMLSKAEHMIVWGGNYFTDYLPPTMQWLVWDKGQRDFSLADCEFAWSSQRKASRIFDYPRALALKDGKQHATQKPVALMDWCMDILGYPGIVLDPFMGSGTTGVSCVNLGKQFLGIEVNPLYFDIACQRIEAAQSQGRLFA
jgi:DNA modification methylase